MPSSDRSTELALAFAREWASVIGALVGGSATLEDGTAASPAADWRIEVSIDGPESGFLTLGLGTDDALEICRRVMGLDGDVPAAAVIDTLREFGGQATGSLSQDSVARGLTLHVDVSQATDPIPDHASTFLLALDDTRKVTLTLWGAVVDAIVAETAPAPMPASPVYGASSGHRADRQVPANLDVILDIDLPISVRFGFTEMSLLALTRLGPGSIVDLGRSPDDPVDVLISGKVVARGEVVVVTGNYGVRITEVVSTADRIRSMGA